MPHWISETIMAIVNFVPALLVAEESPNFPLIRTMFALLLIVLVVWVVAMRPFARHRKTDPNRTAQKP
jgi:hypothetical protein